MACDLCGNVATDLTTLKPEYQTPDIKMICCDCERDVNAQKSKILIVALNMHNSWLLQWMQNMRAALATKKGTK